MFCFKNFSLQYVVTGILANLFFSAISFGQLAQPFRYERLQKNSDDYFHVISLKENGIALFREREKYKNNNKLWELILLDTTLQEKKTIGYEIKG